MYAIVAYSHYNWRGSSEFPDCDVYIQPDRTERDRIDKGKGNQHRKTSGLPFGATAEMGLFLQIHTVYTTTTGRFLSRVHASSLEPIFTKCVCYQREPQ